MDGSTGEGRKAYSAFISYSSADRAFAERLQRRLETYRFPKRVAASTGMARLPPVFRDRTELVAAPDLSQSIRDALDASACLIVVCSPDAAQSEWVKYEIEYFSRSRAQPCLWAAIARGDPATAFPPALIAAAGGANPLAADFRPERDGERLALLKLIAAMAGVGLDDLVRRDTQRRITSLKWSAAAAIAATGATASVAVVTLQARATAAAEQARCRGMVRYYLDEGREKARAAGKVEVAVALNQLVGGCFRGRSLISMSAEERWDFADVLHEDASNQATLGDLGLAKAAVDLAYHSTRGVLENQPDDPMAIFAHAQSEHYVALNAWSRRDLTSAWGGFRRYLGAAKRLNAMEPTNPKYQLELPFAISNLASLTLRETGNVSGARRAFAGAQQGFEAALAREPNNTRILAEAADGESWLADAARLDNDYEAARIHRERQHVMAERLMTADPSDARFKAALLVARIGMARLMAEQGLRIEAAPAYARALALAAEMISNNPKSAPLAKQKRALELFQVQNWLAMRHQERPALSRISKVLGDCETEWKKQGNTELAAFCSLQAGRLARAENRESDLQKLLSDQRLKRALKTSRITATWRLNLQSETQSLITT